jgi:hypothetical protein
MRMGSRRGLGRSRRRNEGVGKKEELVLNMVRKSDEPTHPSGDEWRPLSDR